MCRRTFLRAKCAIVRIIDPGNFISIRPGVLWDYILALDVLPRQVPQQLLHARAPELVLVLLLIPDPVLTSIRLHQEIGNQPGLYQNC